MLSLFLGAGFSKWAAGLPVASELFDFNIQPFGIREPKKLEDIRNIKKWWDSENPDGNTEEFIAFAIKRGGKCKKLTLWYISRRLSEQFIWEEFQSGRIRRHTLMIDEYRKNNIEGVNRTNQFIQRFNHPNFAGTITTNYDLLVEYALGTKSFNYGNLREQLIGRGPYPVSQYQNPTKLTGRIPIAKIHGSLSWYQGKYYTDGRGGITGKVDIVAPTPEKKPPEELSNVWDLANRILDRSTSLLVFGFAFNPYDEAVLNLLKTGGRNIENVMLVDIYPQINRAIDIWPNADIMGCKPDSEYNDILSNWLSEYT